MAVSATLKCRGHRNNTSTNRTSTSDTFLNFSKGVEQRFDVVYKNNDEISHGEVSAEHHRSQSAAVWSSTVMTVDGNKCSVDGEQQLTRNPVTTQYSDLRFHSNDNSRLTFPDGIQLVSCRQSTYFSVSTCCPSSNPLTVNDSLSSLVTTKSCLTERIRTGLCLLLASLWNTLLKELSQRRRFRFPSMLLPSFPNMYIHITTLLLIVSIVFTTTTEACSSRSTPKPRPPSSPMRPNITFPTFACPPAYATWYCLNGATCFTVEISESILYNCVCAEGFTGPRCEFKDLDGSYLPSKEKIMIEKASIASGVTIAILLMVIISIAVYVYSRRRRKEKSLDQTDSPNLASRPFTSVKLQSLRHQRAPTSQSHPQHDVEAGSNFQREPSPPHYYSNPSHLQGNNGFSFNRGSQL